MANPFAALNTINKSSQPKPVNGFAIGQQIGGQIKTARTNAALADVLDPNNTDPAAAFKALAGVDAGVANKVQQQRLSQSNVEFGQDLSQDKFDFARESTGFNQDLARDKFQFTQDEAARKAAIPTKREIIKGNDGFSYFADTQERVLPNVERVVDAEGNIDKSKFVQSLRKEFTQRTKGISVARDALQKIRISAKDGTGAGDVSMIFQYMKMLDPTSVVREGEFATARDTAGIPASIVNSYNKAVDGTFLTPEQRNNFVGLADKFFVEQNNNFQQTKEQFENEAKQIGVDPRRISLDFAKTVKTVDVGDDDTQKLSSNSFIPAKFKSLADNRVKPNLIEKWEEVQSAFGRELLIESGFRDPARNKKAGGASKSQHIHGNAIDIDTGHLSNAEKLDLIKKASAAGFTGIGVYNNNLHFDLGGRRSWGVDFKSGSVPKWALPTIRKHLAKQHKAEKQTPNAPQQVTGGRGADNIPVASDFELPPTNRDNSPVANVIEDMGNIATEAGQVALDVAGSAVNQIPFNDEIAGAVGGLIDTAVQGGNVQENIDQSIDEQRALVDERQERAPIASQVGQVIGQTGVGVAGALASGGGNILAQPFSKTLGQSIAAGGVGGGLVAGGVAEGTLEERLPAIATGAAIGETLGTVIPSAIGAVQTVVNPAIRVVGNVAQRVKQSPQDAAIRKLSKAVQADDVPIEQAREALEEATELGVPTSPVDLFGSNVAREARRVKVESGKGGEKVVAVLNERQATQPNRVVNATNKMFGNPDDFTSILSTVKESRARVAAPLYEKAYEKQIDISPKIVELWKRPSMQPAVRKAQQLAKEQGESIIEQRVVNGEIKDVVSMKGWDYIKRALADQSGASKSGGVKANEISRSIDATRKELTDELKRLNPDYKKALDMYSGSKQMQESFEIGQKIIKKAPHEVEEIFRVASNADKEMMRLGLADSIRLQMGANSNQNRNFANQLFTSENFKRMRPLFPNAQSFAKFKRMIKLEQERFFKSQSVLGGSTSVDKAVDSGVNAGNILDTVFGGVKGAARKGLTSSIGKLFSGIDDKVNSEIADLILERNPERITETLSRLEFLASEGIVTKDNLAQTIGLIMTVSSAQFAGELIGQQAIK